MNTTQPVRRLVLRNRAGEPRHEYRLRPGDGDRWEQDADGVTVYAGGGVWSHPGKTAEEVDVPIRRVLPGAVCATEDSL